MNIRKENGKEMADVLCNVVLIRWIRFNPFSTIFELSSKTEEKSTARLTKVKLYIDLL